MRSGNNVKNFDKLDLLKIFKGVKYDYCIIKCPENFPDYNINSDVDIWVYNIDAFIENVTILVKDYLQNGWYFEIVKLTDTHVQMDFKKEKNNNVLDIKLDMYSSLPEYKRTNIKDSFFVYVMENSTINKIGVRVPDNISECLIRYIEFIEWYDIRADKIKHADFILAHIGDLERNKFFDRLYYFTKPYYEQKQTRYEIQPIEKQSLFKRIFRKKNG